jgi:hypothetical protein
MGAKDGFGEPESITDVKDETVLIRDFWNYDSKEWDKSDRAKSEGHCTSVSAVDWDNDGDLDLLLGDYYGGRIFLRLNEGTAKQSRFALTNSAVSADGTPIVIKNGLAAPRVVDWNGDGLFDILCGGAKGGVYYFKNTGDKKSPQFSIAETLIEPVNSQSTSGYSMKVPAKNGQPTLPGTSYHIEPVDFDGDGDLDLLVGGRSSWLERPAQELTTKEIARRDEIAKQSNDLRAKLVEISNQAKTKEEIAKQRDSEELKVLVKRFQELQTELRKYRTNSSKSGDFVWLYRRKS